MARSWEERRLILSAIISEHADKPLADFKLTPAEDVFFRARARRCVAAMAKKTSIFKAYYDLPVNEPLRYVLGLLLVIITFAGSAGAYLAIREHGNAAYYPLLAACGTVAVAAAAAGVAGWIAHRNAVRQNTTNIIFARFAQTAFTESLHRFHKEFGYDPSEKVCRYNISKCRTRDDEGARAVDACNYLLNYYEMISCGILRGDLDPQIIRDNIKGTIIYYYDKCEPYILECNKQSSTYFENLMKVRTHYREP